MKSEASPVQPGDIVAGKYRVDRIIGQGGMGVVVAATHMELREVRAVKFLLASAMANGENVERFRREARTVLKLKSEHIARVLDVGKAESGAPFMVMEYLDGQDLGELIKRRGPLSLETAILYVLQAMDAVAEAHAKGIIHRDLKPANLFLTTLPSGMPSVKVLDFGISKTPKETAQDVDMTNTHAVLGSPQYMSPEQMRATRDVDVRTDIWSLGVILYQLTTGKFPFRGRNSTEIIALMFSTRPEPPSHFAPHLPAAFDEIVMRCLMLDPAERYATVSDLAAALALLAPPSASFLVERIARYAGAEARKTDAGVTETAGLVPSEWNTPVNETMSSAPTNALIGPGKTEVMVAPVKEFKMDSPSSMAPTRVLIAAPNAEVSMSSAPTRVQMAAPVVEHQRVTTEVMPPSAAALGAPVESPSSVMVTASWKNARSSGRAAYVVIGVIVAVAVVVAVMLMLGRSG